MVSYPVTYKQLRDILVDNVKRVCLNVSNYSSIPASLKSGAVLNSSTYTGTGGEESKYWKKMYVKWTISNPISNVAGSVVETDFDSLLSTYGIQDYINDNITPRGVFEFFCVASIFCSARVKVAATNLASSSSTSNKYIIYDRSTAYATVAQYSQGDVAIATDINTLTTELIKIISTSAKGYQVKYTESLIVN